jgi:hypothetical protein
VSWGRTLYIIIMAIFGGHLVLHVFCGKTSAGYFRSAGFFYALASNKVIKEEVWCGWSMWGEHHVIIWHLEWSKIKIVWSLIKHITTN